MQRNQDHGSEERSEEQAAGVSRRGLLAGAAAAAGALGLPLLGSRSAAAAESETSWTGFRQESGAISGFWHPTFRRVRDEFLRNFTQRGEVGASVCVMVGSVPVVDLWGGTANPVTNAALAEGHAGARVVVHEGRHRALRAPARFARAARPRRAGRAVLARVRPEREGGNHRRDADEPQGGRAGDPAAAAAGRALRLGLHDRDARRGGALLGAGHASRLPRAHLRLPGGRAGAPHLGPPARRLLPRGDRAAARPRLLADAARERGRAGGAEPPGCAALRPALPGLVPAGDQRPDLDPRADLLQQRGLPDPRRGGHARGARGRDRCDRRHHQRARAVPSLLRARAPAPFVAPEPGRDGESGAHVTSDFGRLRPVRPDPLALHRGLHQVDGQPARHAGQPGQRHPLRGRLRPLGLRRLDRLRRSARRALASATR